MFVFTKRNKKHIQTNIHKDECIETVVGKYTYKVCLFDKVTQHENYYSWNLGIFNQWEICGDDKKNLCLHYNDGQVCGSGAHRQTHVELACDQEKSLKLKKKSKISTYFFFFAYFCVFLVCVCFFLPRKLRFCVIKKTPHTLF